MTRNARRPLLLLLAGAVAPGFCLTACASASSTVASASSTVASASSTAPADAHVAIPAAAQTLTLSLNYGGNADGRKPPPPVTVTSSAKVSGVARLVAGQPPQQPPGVISCPASDGKALTLIFRADPGGPALATAVLGLDVCEFTDLTVSAEYHSLGEYGSARSMAAKVLQVAGLAWKLPPFAWPVPS